MRVALAAGLVALMSIVVVPKSDASISCTGTVTGVVNGSIDVPDDGPGEAACVLDAARVTGSVMVHPGGEFTARNGTQIQGNVVGDHAESVYIDSTNGSVHIGGSVTVVGESDRGPSAGGESGGVCGGDIGGSLTVTEIGRYSAGWFASGAGGVRGCPALRIGGSVSVSNDVEENGLDHAVVGGSVTFTNNTDAGFGPPDLISGNRITGSLNCSGNTNGEDDNGVPNIAARKTGQCASL